MPLIISPSSQFFYSHPSFRIIAFSDMNWIFDINILNTLHVLFLVICIWSLIKDCGMHLLRNVISNPPTLFGYSTFICKSQQTWLKVAENFVTLHKDSSRVSMFTKWAQQVRGQDGKQVLGLCSSTMSLGLFSVIYHEARGSPFFFAFFLFVFNLLKCLGWEILHVLPTVFSSFPTVPLESIWSHIESGRILLLWLSGIVQWKNNSIERKWLVIYAIISMSPVLCFSVLTGV